MMRNRTIGIILLLLTAISVSAQKAERDYIRKGNRAYKDSTYVNAEVNYRKAIDVNPKSAISMYNLGNTLCTVYSGFYIFCKLNTFITSNSDSSISHHHTFLPF